jgi:hypothetical protein
MPSQSFLLGFQEKPLLDGAKHDSVGTETFTESREEPDQDISLGEAGTETFTKAREESDQDVGIQQYLTIPRSVPCY